MTEILPPIREFREALWELEQHNSNIEIPYRPSKEQLNIHLDKSRFKQVAGGERAGKSRFASRELADWLFWRLPQDAVGSVKVGKDNYPALFWLVGPDYELALPEFDYIVDILGGMDAIDGKASRNKRDSSTVTTKFGTRIETKTASDAQKIAGFSPNGIVICEAAQCSYEVFLRCIQRVSQSRGWVLACGTFESSIGWYAELWEQWQAPNDMGGKSFSLPTWSNLHVFPGGENDPEILRLKASMPEERFLERVGAVPSPPSTVVFREFNSIKHVPGYVDYKPDLPVMLAVDPGYSEAYAVCAIQELHDKIWVVDEVYKAQTSGREVITICKSRPWWKSVEAIYMDIASRQHHSDYSQEELWRTETGMSPILRKLSIQDGIDIYHKYLSINEDGSPGLLFSTKCQNTIKEHFNYRYPTNKDNTVTSETPVDRANHSIKAITYYLSNRKTVRLLRVPSYTRGHQSVSELYA